MRQAGLPQERWDSAGNQAQREKRLRRWPASDPGRRAAFAHGAHGIGIQEESSEVHVPGHGSSKLRLRGDLKSKGRRPKPIYAKRAPRPQPHQPQAETKNIGEAIQTRDHNVWQAHGRHNRDGSVGIDSGSTGD